MLDSLARILSIAPGWLVVPVLLGIAVALYAIDPPLMAWIQRRRTRATDALARLVKPLGDGRYTLPPLALLFIIGVVADLPWATRTFVLSLISFLLTGAICQTLQILTRRHRPDSSATARDWAGPRLRSPHRSFPSGHASASASVLVVIGLLAHGLPPLQVLAFALAALTAFSRLNDHAHWPSDVFTGVAIGAGVAFLTVTFVSLPV